VSENFENELRDIASALETAAKQAGLSPEITGVAASVTPDEPIRSSAEDRLNRSDFAAELARAILQFDRTESVVVGIHGRWGTGKTSLLNLIHEKLQQVSPEAPIIFRFNPWGFSDQEQLTMKFFGEMAAFLRLHLSIPSLVAISDSVEAYGEMLSPLARLIFPRATEAVRVGWKWLRKLKPGPPRTSTELKDRINSGLRQSGLKFIIMIDDIDRLNAAEIRQTFQLIKLNANFSNTVYVIAFDKRPVEKALKQVSPGPAKEYLEKIIQISFSLPPIAETTLTEIILTTFNEIITSLGIQNVNMQRFGNMFHSGFRASFKTIRDANRYFNLFRFVLNLMRRDTNFIDLAAIEALAVFYPNLYQAIEANDELFAGAWGGLNERREKETERKKYDKIFSYLRSPRRDAAISLCTFLFPKLEWIYGPSNTIYGSESEKQWQKQKRVAASKYFPYYFQLAVPPTEVSQSELDRAIEETKSVTAFVEVLRRFKDSQRFSPFIDRLREHLGSLEPAQLLVILESIFVFGDELETESAVLFGVISEYIRFGMWLLFDILDVLGTNRFNLLCDAMHGRPAVFTISDVTVMFDRVISGAKDSAQLRSRYPELSGEIVAQMKKISLDAIELAVRENRLQTVPRLRAVLYRWREWGDAKRVSDWVASTFLRSPEGAVAFAVAFAYTITSASVTDKVAKSRLTVQVKEMGQLADLDVIAKLLRDASDDKLTDKQREAKARFLSTKAKLDAGENPDDRFPFDDDTVE
jgi:predicted KAP-like P-loop ATPase